MFILNINMKSYMGNPTAQSHTGQWHLTLNGLDRTKSRTLTFWVVDLNAIHIFVSRLLIWVSHKIICGWTGISAIPVVFFFYFALCWWLCFYNFPKQGCSNGYTIDTNIYTDYLLPSTSRQIPAQVSWVITTNQSLTMGTMAPLGSSWDRRTGGRDI